MNKERLIIRLDEFWRIYDRTLEGEWSVGLGQDEWDLLKDVKEALK